MKKRNEPMGVISTIVTVFSIITLVVIIGLGFKKLFGSSNASIFIREYIQKLIGKLLYLLVFVFYFIPIDGLAVTLINKLRGTEAKSWREINNLNKWGSIWEIFVEHGTIIINGIRRVGYIFWIYS